MRKREIEKFRKILARQRVELDKHAKSAVGGEIHLDPDDFPDEIDSASSEMSLAFQGRLRERERGLLTKVEGALKKLEAGIFGECESCGEDIGLKRLEARPVAELCIECKSEQEQLERKRYRGRAARNVVKLPSPLEVSR